MLIETTLVATNDTHSEAVSFDIPDGDWSLLVAFRKHSEVLRSTRFVQEGRGGSITFKWKAGEPIRMGSNLIEEEPIWAMLLKLRPFVLQKEQCYLPSVLKILKRHLSHPAIHRHLDQLRDAFMLKSMNQRIQMSGPGRPPLSQAVIMDWLNSYHYHHDDAKAESVVRDLGPFAEQQDGLGIATFVLVDMVQAVLANGELIETLQLCHEGLMPEIRCPADFFQQR
ncbi:hypothetical protein [Pseudomonas fluorescens]|uniref:Uncharacterized protein n=1 Tax=Pseudomonas fluorescens TaxID=294 RepID=A0AAE2PXZ9_PSEFL|nr:hypothetical protein [Pseudomonas fluorescens]MBD8270238.1 hypothetical protein [Pseudomonas fluorescens]